MHPVTSRLLVCEVGSNSEQAPSCASHVLYDSITVDISHS